MPEPCNSRPFSCLMKSCFPNPHTATQPHHNTATLTTTRRTTISSLPDDLLLECLSRVPTSTLPTLSLVSKRWLHLLSSPSFLRLRRHHSLLTPTLFSLSSLSSATLRPPFSQWKLLSTFLPNNASFLLSHARLVSLGPRIYIINRNSTTLYHTWTGNFSARSPMLHPRKKFAASAVNGKIYIAGGSPSSGTLEEYDPDADSWRVVSHAPRRRYGCVGAAVGNVFYVIGGLKIGEAPRATYASSMDLYDVVGRIWLRSRAVPGGGCVVAAACAVNGCVFVLASHAVELSFWRFNACVGSEGFGGWTRVKTPPLPAQVRLDTTVRFSCVGIESENKVVLVQVMGCIDDLLRRSGRNVRAGQQQQHRQGLVLVYDTLVGEWSRVADLPEVVQRAAFVSVEC